MPIHRLYAVLQSKFNKCLALFAIDRSTDISFSPTLLFDRSFDLSKNLIIWFLDGIKTTTTTTYASSQNTRLLPSKTDSEQWIIARAYEWSISKWCIDVRTWWERAMPSFSAKYFITTSTFMLLSLRGKSVWNAYLRGPWTFQFIVVVAKWNTANSFSSLAHCHWIWMGWLLHSCTACSYYLTSRKLKD